MNDADANSPRPVRFATVGFDLDGTLVDSAPDIGNALNHALGLAGIAPIPIERVRPMIGGGAKRLLGQALAADAGTPRVEQDRIDGLYAELLDHYEANIAVGTTLYPGVLDAIDTLREGGVSVGVATNKLEHLAVRLIDGLGIADRFDAVLGGDTLGTERAKPERDMLDELARRCGGTPAAFIGDSKYDIGAARAAGWPSVAVTFGYPGDTDLALADARIDDYEELLPTLAAL